MKREDGGFVMNDAHNSNAKYTTRKHEAHL